MNVNQRMEDVYISVLTLMEAMSVAVKMATN